MSRRGRARQRAARRTVPSLALGAVGGAADSAPNRGANRRWIVRTCGLTLLVLATMALVASDAAGQRFVNEITESYRAASLLWTGRLIRNAQRMFALLAGFEVIVTATLLLLRPKRLDEAAGNFVLKLLVLSLCFFAITSFDLLLPKIFDSYVQAGQTVSIVTLNPAMVGGMGLMLAGKIMAGAAIGPLGLNPAMMQIGLVVGLLVVLAFAAIACQIVYSLVEAYVLFGLGPFFLAFAGFRATAKIFDNYTNYIFYAGTKVFLLYGLVPTGVVAISRLSDVLNANPFFLDLTGPLEAFLVVASFCGLVCFLPQSFASRMTNGVDFDVSGALKRT